MPPRLIRQKRAFAVRQVRELTAFLISCNDERLKSKVEDAFNEMKANYEVGDKVRKDLWPKYYKKTWGINNLYVYPIGPDWRITYFLDWPAVGVQVICLEILTHREYDNRFRYRTS